MMYMTLAFDPQSGKAEIMAIFYRTGVSLRLIKTLNVSLSLVLR